MKSRESIFSLSWIYVYLVILFLLGPLLALVLLSLSRTIYLQFPPALFSLKWYQNLMKNEDLIESFFLSLRVAIPATLLSTFCGTLAALGSRVLSKRLSKFNHLLFLAPLIVPYVILATGLSRLFMLIGFRGLDAITLSHATIALPYVFLLVHSGLNLLPNSVEEAARLLGAGRFAVLRKITLPLLRAHILAGMMFAFIASFGEFIIAYMLSGPRTKLLTVYIYLSIRDRTEPSISALLTIITTAVILIAFIASHYYVRNNRA